MVKPRVAAVIQARMGSTRMPGKVLMPLAGKPVLWHIIHRLRKCITVDVIAIATSDLPIDDSLEAFAQAEGIECVRGSEDNVLQRYAKAAELLVPDIIVRITGDAPLLDPCTLDRLVDTLTREGAEYCTGEAGVASIHEGFCPFTRRALNRLLAEAADDPVAVEHVTAYFVAHPESFRIARISIPSEHRFGGARISVDTPADMQFIEEIYRRLAVQPGEADITEVVGLLRTQPELLKINGHIYQKKPTDRSLKVLIRCDGDSAIGLGHVVRCLALADELRERYGCGVTFAMAGGEPGMSLVREEGFPLVSRSDGGDEGAWLGSVMKSQRPDIIVIDVRSALPRDKVRDWRRSGVLVVAIDDPSDRRLEADMVFYPPVPQVGELDWRDFSGELYSGWKWVILRKSFTGLPSSTDGFPPHILVTMGGSDPAGLTLLAVRALDTLDHPFEATLVTGAGFHHAAQLSELLNRSRHPFRVESGISDMAGLMATADLAVASFGVTAYELAALGVPGILACLTADHARSASRLVEAGIAEVCGVCPDIKVEEIVRSVRGLLEDPARRRRMKENARGLLDGRGAVRIAERILERSKALNG
jgi:spore coat polysaccharide biosynthesis protein SpsF